MRSTGASKVLHVVLRTQASGGKLLLPALHIFQIITKNRKTLHPTWKPRISVVIPRWMLRCSSIAAAVCSVLARDGVAPTLEKLLSATGVLPCPRLRLVLMVIANLCRNRKDPARGERRICCVAG